MKILMIISVSILFSCHTKEILETYEDHSTKLECEMKDGLKHGACVQYFENGNKEYESIYENDILNGKSIFYHPNGEINWEVDFVNGVKEGEILYFDSVGNKTQKSTFKQSILNGQSIAFNKKGDVVFKMNYDNGVLNGVWESFYDGGQPKTKAIYSNGIKLDFTTLDSLGNEIDRMIKYEITHRVENDSVHLTVKMLNQMYDVIGVGISDFNSPKEDLNVLLVKEYNEDNFVNLKFNKPIGQSTFIVIGYINDIQDLEGGNGVVKRSLDFEYVINDTAIGI